MYKRQEEVVPQNDQKGCCLRAVVGTALASIIILVIIDSMRGNKIESLSLQFLEWLQRHPYDGVLAVILVYVIATVCFIPGSILTLGTGYAFGKAMESTAYGVFLASVAVFLGASLGSIMSFLLGRYLLRGCVLRMTHQYPLFQAIDLGKWLFALIFGYSTTQKILSNL